MLTHYPAYLCSLSCILHLSTPPRRGNASHRCFASLCIDRYPRQTRSRSCCTVLPYSSLLAALTRQPPRQACEPAQPCPDCHLPSKRARNICTSQHSKQPLHLYRPISSAGLPPDTLHVLDRLSTTTIPNCSPLPPLGGHHHRPRLASTSILHLDVLSCCRRCCCCCRCRRYFQCSIDPRLGCHSCLIKPIASTYRRRGTHLRQRTQHTLA